MMLRILGKLVYALDMTRFFLSIAAFMAIPLTLGTARADRPEIMSVEVPLSSLVAQDAGISKIIYLNRCKGGCQVKSGAVNNSLTNESTIGPPGTNTLTAFNGDDTEWSRVVKCVQEAYSPYNVTVTDVDPSPMFHGEAMVGGLPTEIGLPNNVGGVSPYAGCSPINNVITFTFSNLVSPSTDRALYLCGVIGQESAHSYGLDHEFDCSSPMTYLPYCGQSFFRNKNTDCGEYTTRVCRCGGTQNSHTSLLATFGPGTVPTGNPVSLITAPAAGATVPSGLAVVANASDRRGLTRAELWVNGYKWTTYEEKRTPDKQTGTFSIATPKNIPDGVMDIQLKAYNDLEMMTTSPTVTVTKGAPCATAATCGAGQQCAAGKCFWEAATGAVGDACEFPQFCESGKCEDLGDGLKCTKTCFAGVSGTCPENFECVAAGNGSLCATKADGGGGGGCCSVNGDTSTALLVNGGIGMLILGTLVGRRRKR
jgi:hypothetical protein